MGIFFMVDSLKTRISFILTRQILVPATSTNLITLTHQIKHHTRMPEYFHGPLLVSAFSTSPLPRLNVASTTYFMEEPVEVIKVRREKFELAASSAFQEYKKRSRGVRLSTGISELDDLLEGGIVPDQFYLFWGPRKILASIFHQLVVQAYLPSYWRGGAPPKIAFVDGDFSFDPYSLSRQAALNHLDSSLILDNTMISRAFDWQNMVELVGERLKKLDARMFLITGLTTHFDPTIPASFRELLRIVGAFKSVLLTKRAIGVAATLQDPHSNFKPLGGKILTHFATVLVRIIARPKYIEYQLLKGGAPRRRFQWQKPDLPLQTSLEHFWRTG